MNKILTFAMLTCFYLTMVSCSKKQAAELKPDDGPPDPPAEEITYANFAQALFQNKCNACHAPGGTASGMWTFNGHASVVANSNRIRQAVLVNKTMPKTGSLSAAELTSLQTWFDNGLPQ
ncbi:hypothetical protein [Pedobacter deserti]|uniref:hypothetical protein n=1 Tax=Pedobacter deserti TaxID=2817382 RepID=UPI00210CB634|nr:hypothetical protein [Pedobacter sp. SYSU D00382]